MMDLISRTIGEFAPRSMHRLRERYVTRGARPLVLATMRRESRVAPRSQGVDQALRVLMRTSSLPHLLRFEDRNSMAFSVEARVPFLDYRLVDFVFGFCGDLRFRDGWTKWLLRRAVEPVVPREVVWRRDKMGFQTPERQWLTSLGPRLATMFEKEPRSESLLDPRECARALHGGPHRAPSAAWRAASVELWLRARALDRAAIA